MKALVTGGAGFIGSNLVRLLVQHGYQIKVLDNLSTGYQENLKGLDVELVQGDIRSADLVNQCVEGVDVIFHLAAHIGNVKSINFPRDDASINVLGAVNLLEAAKDNHVQKIVYSSSAATFGELKYVPIDEAHPQDPDSPYGVSKLAAEKYMLCYGKLYGLSITCLRYFNVFGINQRYDAYGNVIPIFANRLYNQQALTIFGDGEQTRDFVNVKDVAQANFLASQQCEPGADVFNLGSGQSITINQLAKYMIDVSGVDVPVEHAAPRPGEVRHCRADISKAQNQFGFQPEQDFLQGLKEYYPWFVADKKK